MFGPKKPNYLKLRTNLRLVINRLKLLEKKKTELALKARREIADYIKICKDDRARIRVEHIIREDYLVEAMEIVEMFCDLLLARFGIIEKMVEMDPGLEEPIATILWITPRLSADVPELLVVSQNLMLKYGKEFAMACQNNSIDKVNDKVLVKMAVTGPPRKLIELYLIEIAKTFDVPFTPDEAALMEDELAEAQNLLDLEFTGAPGGVPRPPPGKPPGGPPGGWGGGSGGGGGGGMVPPDLFTPGPGYPPAQQYPPAASQYPGPPPQGGQYPGPPPPMSLPPGYSPPGEGPPGYSAAASAPPPAMGYGVPPPLPSQPPVGGSVPGNAAPAKPPRCTQDPPWNPQGPQNGLHDSPPEYPRTGSTNDSSPPPPVPPPRDQSSSTPSVGNKPVPAPRNMPSQDAQNPALPTIPGLPTVPSGNPSSNSMFMNLPSVPSDSVRSAGGDDIDFDDLTRRFEDLKKK